jgi:GNAT superfamily N-acetyltransferase
MIEYRTATETDIPQLAAMRWDFRLEEAPGTPAHDRPEFLRACEAFLRDGLSTGQWTCWLAGEDSVILSHIFVQRVAKVPKPNKLEDAFGYMTNVYTRPAYRGQGIGSRLMEKVLAWAAAVDLEMVIVWPSEASIRFYERAGFSPSDQALEYTVRPYVP